MYGDLNDDIFNTTLIAKNLSNTLWICLDAADNYFIYVETKMAAFGDITGWLTALI
jgi:hypothetical protein